VDLPTESACVSLRVKAKRRALEQDSGPPAATESISPPRTLRRSSLIPVHTTFCSRINVVKLHVSRLAKGS